MNLSDAIYNSLLWTPGKVAAKGSATLGQVYFNLGYAYSTDGFVFLRVNTGLPSILEGFIDGAALKPLGVLVQGDLKKSPTGDIKFWTGVQRMLSSTPAVTYGDTFAISPERLGKFSLLRPRGEYPVDLAHSVTADEQEVVAFRYGPDVLGIFSPLDREHLQEVYFGQSGVLW